MGARRHLTALPDTQGGADLLTVDAAAAELHCSRRTIFRLTGSGDLASIKVGRSRLIAREDLDRYINALRTAAR